MVVVVAATRRFAESWLRLRSPTLSTPAIQLSPIAESPTWCAVRLG